MCVSSCLRAAFPEPSPSAQEFYLDIFQSWVEETISSILLHGREKRPGMVIHKRAFTALQALAKHVCQSGTERRAKTTAGDMSESLLKIMGRMLRCV
jgi:hypothetical protein